MTMTRSSDRRASRVCAVCVAPLKWACVCVRASSVCTCAAACTTADGRTRVAAFHPPIHIAAVGPTAPSASSSSVDAASSAA